MDEPKQDGKGVENVLSSEPRIDGCYVAMNLAVNKQENPSPSNSLRPHSVKAKSRQESFRELKTYINSGQELFLASFLEK